MFRYTIKNGDTFYDIVRFKAKVKVPIIEMQAYGEHCKSTKGSVFPNLLVPGDEIEVPSREEWKKIKEGEQ